jgi:hypothetical protein
MLEIILTLDSNYFRLERADDGFSIVVLVEIYRVDELWVD